jgi:catechol 2,3-dioxygenase-like lactoylglutathione lyase family enzyme
LKGQFHHVQVNVSDLRRSDEFYDNLLTWLGYKRILSIDQSRGKDMAGWERGGSTLYIKQAPALYLRKGFHRKQVGLNHIAFWASSKSEVDRFYKAYLSKRRMGAIYGAPKDYSSKGAWYSVYFEDPDRIKLEVVWTPR